MIYKNGIYVLITRRKLPTSLIINLGKLRRESERVKRALSSQHQIRVEIESLFDGVDFSEPFTRARVVELNNDLFRING